jgi:hypothetical protein
MIGWKQAFHRARRSGAAASLLSAAALAVCGKIECNSATGPLNAPSQWLWGEGAARRRRASLRETAVGYAIHHGTSVGWATLHEKLVGGGARSLGGDLHAGIATAAVACLVDYKVARGRLQPGFDKHRGKRSHVVVYGAFAIGLALGTARRRR